MNNYLSQGGYPPPHYYPQQPAAYPPGYYPPPPNSQPPPGYNLGRAIMPNQAGNKAKRIMSTLFNVGKELKEVERSAEYQRGGLVFNHMDKNRAYMNSTDDIEIVATQMDRLLKGESAPEPSMPIDINSVQEQFMSNNYIQQPIQYQQPQYNTQENQIQPQHIKSNIMPIDVNQYLNQKQTTAIQQPVVSQQPTMPAINLTTIENALAELNNKIEAIAQMVGMLVQGQKNSVEAIQQAMSVSIGDSVAKAVSGALNTFVEMQNAQMPDFDASFVPGESVEEAESEQA